MLKFSVLVESVTVVGVEPVNVIVCVPVPALSLMVAVAVRWPLAVGVNVKLIVHEAFGCTVESPKHGVPEEGRGTAKSPGFAPLSVTTFPLLA